ncbi:MAG TPA: beta-ketoacyl-[acyl-carrier-protein] synthase family protein [Holophaga sp.]|nr:beta-ketoacyl-[acyl-carrier-protein] synthase family protein [Holophaga sp.]HPS67357.1 beta-ketoacyl-[acyl-carrier-protein] synthase family protein [Holophaga sp.]
MRRVVVTGLGMVTSLGLDTETTWRRMRAGDCGIGPLRSLSLPAEPVQIAAQVDLPADAPGGRRSNKCDRMALLALEDALAQSGPDLDSGDPRRRGVFQGAGTSGLPTGEAYLLDRMAGKRGRAADPVFQNSCGVTDVLGLRLGAMGPRSTIMNACSSSLMAIGQAWEQVAHGDLDLAVAGGAEALCRMTFAGFSCLKAMDPAPCRPFSRDRAGLNLGEGAVHLVLEPLNLAKARGAGILAEVLGYGASMDAHHPTAPHPEGDGAARAIQMALRVSGLFAEEVDLVSAHATATPANDGSETLAIRRALGDAAKRVSVTASKSQFGHTLGAAGAVGAATAVLCLRDQVVSPTLRLEDPDPLCDLDCTPLAARERRLGVALVNAFAFGGNNVCLALRRWEGR